MPEADDTDEDLVRRFRAGDEGAGTVLFERLFPVLRPGLRRKMGAVLRPKVGESDLIQSAYASVVRRLDDFRDGGPGSFRRWLAGILDHKMIDEIRRHQGRGKRERGREFGLDALSEFSVPLARGESPSRAAMAGEDRRRIRAAVDLLSPDHRTVVRLLHEKALSMDEVATAMERTPEAVRKLYARALERLGVLLAEDPS
jgi:RNA polymerase sigma-70 factor, ECF subfamily